VQHRRRRDFIGTAKRSKQRSQRRDDFGLSVKA
jgi:hypothetical protein